MPFIPRVWANGEYVDAANANRWEQGIVEALALGGASDAAVATQINTGAATQAAGDARWQTKVLLDPVSFGAVANGVAEDQDAIEDAASAAATFGCVLWFSDKVYGVKKLTGKDHCIELRAGLVVAGPGTVKVLDGTGNYSSVFKGASWGGTDLSRIQIRDITIDQNNTGNPVAVVGSLLTEPGFRMAIMAGAGEDMVVDNVTIEDVDSINTISFNGAAIRNVRITNCLVKGVGDSPSWHDHSTIYTDSYGATISGNTFIGVPGGLGATTAIETHGPNQVVTANRVYTYYTSANITGASAKGNEGMVCVGNSFNDVNLGLQVWSRTVGGSTQGLEQCVIIGNTMVIDHDMWADVLSQPTPYGIILDAGVDLDIKGLIISGNTIIFKPSVHAYGPQEQDAGGIEFWDAADASVAYDVQITNNVIRGTLAAGIRWSIDGVRVRIENNDIVDPGMSLNEAGLFGFYGNPIVITNAQTDIVVRGNRGFDTRTPHEVATCVATFMTAATRAYHASNTVGCTDGTVLSGLATVAGPALTAPADPALDARYFRKDAPDLIQAVAAINNDYGANVLTLLKSAADTTDAGAQILGLLGAAIMYLGHTGPTSYGLLAVRSALGVMGYGSTTLEVLTGTNLGLLARTDNDAVEVQRGVFKPRAFTTAGRPSAVTVGAQAMIWNSTTGIPNWSNGTDWIDALGTVV